MHLRQCQDLRHRAGAAGSPFTHEDMFTPRFSHETALSLATPMRCFIPTAAARQSPHSLAMFRFDNLAVAWLLLVAAFTGCVDAARPREQRSPRVDVGPDPYLVSPPGLRPDGNARPAPRDLGEKEFSLRHVYHHGTERYPQLHRYKDVSKDAQLVVSEDGIRKQTVTNSFPARALSANIQRMADRKRSTIDTMLDYAKRHGAAMPLSASGWTVDEIPGPNHTDKPTVLSLARMAANAYTEEPWTGNWVDVGCGFNNTESFGWELDGLRGHIYADKTNSTVVIGLKGTSMAIFDGAETTGNDKINDNLFGSCCCAQNGPYTWKQVCDCMNSTYTCNHTCIVRNLLERNHYYWAVKDLYHNVTERYPDAQIWMSGHSLGGVVSTLLGLTFGLPVFTFEAFPDALAASRLGLPTPPGYHIGAHQSRPDLAIHHFGHTADPVFMGSCNGATASCSIGGYAFEGHCHTGKTCIYDTVNDLGWRSSAWSHRIYTVIDDIITKYDSVPECEEDTECTDCVLWKFFESNGTETTTAVSSTSTSATRTRTETCKTPGWWGCLDETTTTTGTSTSSSSSCSTTCETPGWVSSIAMIQFRHYTDSNPVWLQRPNYNDVFNLSRFIQRCAVPDSNHNPRRQLIHQGKFKLKLNYLHQSGMVWL